jgi:hypothetical protein
MSLCLGLLGVCEAISGAQCCEFTKVVDLLKVGAWGGSLGLWLGLVLGLVEEAWEHEHGALVALLLLLLLLLSSARLLLQLGVLEQGSEGGGRLHSAVGWGLGGARLVPEAIVIVGAGRRARHWLQLRDGSLLCCRGLLLWQHVLHALQDSLDLKRVSRGVRIQTPWCRATIPPTNQPEHPALSVSVFCAYLLKISTLVKPDTQDLAIAVRVHEVRWVAFEVKACVHLFGVVVCCHLVQYEQLEARAAFTLEKEQRSLHVLASPLLRVYRHHVQAHVS